jgi:anti-sigma factor RsiW
MSGMTEHPTLQLSAYLDDELTQGEHELVRAHLDGCAECRAELADLRATSLLVAGLPQLAPSRSLVPRLERAPVWLRPVRLLSVMGSGLFVFLFIASAVVNSGSSLGGAATTAEQLAEKGQFGAAVNALASDAAAAKALGPTAAPAVPAAAGQPGPNADTSRSTQVSSPTPVARTDVSAATPPPSVAHDTVRTFGPPPQLFLGLAALCAIAAFVAHRRLHRT